VGLDSYALLFSYAGVVLTAEKRRQLAEVALQRKATPGPFDVDASALAYAPTTATSTPRPFCSNPCRS